MPGSTDNRDLQTIAYETIRNKIVLLQLKPGERLSAISLEKKMNIGRTPIRESFMRLRERGLVKTIPQSGTYVSKISMESAKNACRVRECIERAIAEECCAKLDASYERLFDNALEQQHDAVRAQDPEALFRADNLFHEACYITAGRHMMWEWQSLFNTDFERFRLLRNITEEIDMGAIVRQHAALYDAFKHRDTFDASSLASAHLHQMMDESIPIRKQYADFFEDEPASL